MHFFIFCLHFIQKNYHLFEILEIPTADNALIGKIQAEMDIVCTLRSDSRDLVEVVREMVKQVVTDSNEISSSQKDSLANLQSRIDFLLLNLRERLKCMVVYGWSYRRKMMKEAIALLLHEIFFELVGICSSIIQFLHQLDGLDKKVLAIELFFNTSGKLAHLSEHSLLMLDLKISPLPVLTETIDTSAVLLRYTNVVYDQMKNYPMKAINASIKQMVEKSEFTYTPWAPIKLAGGAFRSNVPEDLKFFLNECLKYSIVPCDQPAHAELIKELNSRIKLGYMKCFLRLATLYRATIVKWQVHSHNLPSHVKDAANEEFHMWLCSIANDTYRILRLNMFNVPDEYVPYFASSVVDLQKNNEILQSFTDLQLDILNAVSNSVTELLFDEKKKLRPANAALETIISEFDFYQANLADISLYDSFSAICADKCVLLYLCWLIKLAKSDSKKGLEYYTQEFDASISSNLRLHPRLAMVFQRFNSTRSALLESTDKLSSDIAIADIWPVLPSWMEGLMDFMVELHASLVKLSSKHARNHALPSNIFKKVFHSSADDSESILFDVLNPTSASRFSSILGSGSNTSKRLIASIDMLSNRRGSLVSNPLSYFSKASGGFSFEIADEENTNILHVKCIKAFDLYDCAQTLEISPLKHAFVEFSIDSQNQRIELMFDTATMTWGMSSCNVSFILDSKIDGKILTCTIHYTPGNIIGSITREILQYGKVKVPLIFIGALNVLRNFVNI